jgi:hypothetical protein
VYAFAISEVMLSRDTFFITAIDTLTETFAAFRTSVIQTSALYGASKRSQEVERDRRTMFADKPSHVVFDGINPAAVATRQPIFCVDLKVPQARRAWLRF